MFLYFPYVSLEEFDTLGSEIIPSSCRQVQTADSDFPVDNETYKVRRVIFTTKLRTD
jgi:hypothetical protein